MIPWIKSLLYDPNSFANFIRFGVFLAGQVLVNAVPNSTAWYVGQVTSAMALLIKAGDKNAPPPSAATPIPPAAV